MIRGKLARSALLRSLLLCIGVCWALWYWNHETPSRLVPAGSNEPHSAAPLEPPAPAVKESVKPLSNRIVEYHMSVELDAGEKRLTGAESITWKNPGQQPVSELYLHLYPNAFTKKSTFLKESGGKLRQDEMKENSYGGMEVLSIKSEDGVDLTHTIQYVQPDDGNSADRTVMKIRLPRQVEPGGKTSLKLQFTVKLPEVYARMGYAGDFIMAGQWFPKLAVYEPKGTRGRTDEGWNVHQYHGNSEFYADFGIYNVKIKVPADYTVAATGLPVKTPVEENGMKTWHFYADDVHDFAWSASPHFVYAEEPFSTPSLPGIRIKLYLDPRHAHLKDRYMLAAKKAISSYSQWYGTYPYSTLSIVVPPPEGNGAGGMEYPTLVTAWGAGDEAPDFELERVVVHEIGHQYWYGIVASNEFEEAWLDEGFTSYVEDRVMESEYGLRPNLPLEAGYMTSPAPLNQPSWHFRSHDIYAENVYTRAKLILTAIERQIGRPQMQKVLKTYFQRWKFRHPGSEDFKKTLEDVTKQPWDEFFRQFVYGNEMVDYAVDRIQSRSVNQDGTDVYEHAVWLKRLGGYHGPVPFVLHFADGTERREEWDGKDMEVKISLTHPAPLVWAAIDPQYTQVLENKHINNFMRAAIQPESASRLKLGTASILEIMMRLIAL
ncbi:M1 family metallopeptidase [Paenibacillus sp. y28]|uniref:M1 family metallopeptidase n=1 Tax=Paenibacillus sp. y28 TaxID=3129110 RepID=UPI003016C481